MSGVFRPVNIFFIILAFTLVFYRDVFSLMIAGDDIQHYLNAPSNVAQFKAQFVDEYHFRPLQKLFFRVYSILPFNLAVFHLISVLLMALNGTCMYVCMKKYLRIPEKLSLATVAIYTISHINFYTIYTLAGVGELLFIFFFWGSMLSYFSLLQSNSRKAAALLFLSFLGAFLTKEIFISIPIILTVVTAIKRKWEKVPLLVFLWLPTLALIAFKLISYNVSDSVYGYELSPQLLGENILHFSLWLVNYRHGWQMGMPLPETALYQVFLGIQLIIFALAGSIALKKRFADSLLLAVWGIAALIPFLFLKRVLVYYLDVTLIAMHMFIALGISYMRWKNNRAVSSIVMLVWLILAVFMSREIQSQWRIYSFPAVSIETATNFYNEVYKPIDWSEKNWLCIEVGGDPAWATHNGEMIQVFTGNYINVERVKDNNLPKHCLQEDAVHVVNKDRTFEIMSE